MPTTKPRVAVTLEPHLHETIKRLAQLQGRSRGAVIADLLEGVHPPLMRTVALLEAARDAPRQVREGLRETAEKVEKELHQAAGGGLDQMDWLMGQLQQTGASESEARGGEPSEKRSFTGRRRNGSVGG